METNRNKSYKPRLHSHICETAYLFVRNVIGFDKSDEYIEGLILKDMDCGASKNDKKSSKS